MITGAAASYQECHQVFTVQHKVLLLHQVRHVPGDQAAGLLLFNALEVGLETVVRICLRLQVRLNLTDLLGNNIREVLQTLFDWILGHVPPKLSHIGGQVNSISQQVLPQFVSLILQNLTKIVCDFPIYLLFYS